MDIRKIFYLISQEMAAKFDQSSEIRHAGGRGTIREDGFLEFLRKYMPNRYAIGRGEVVTSENEISGQLDVVIYDSMRCPVLMPSEAHAVYPAESVYGAISIKSRLNSAELKDSYNNIASLKRILPKSGFNSFSGPGFSTGVNAPIPITGIFAYAADRSMETICAQVKELDAALSDINLRPDFVAILGHGLIGPTQRLRNNFNSYKLPIDVENLSHLSKTGRHTLLRLYLRLLDECNRLTLRPLDLYEYERMPQLIGDHRVSQASFVIYGDGISASSSEVRRLTEFGILNILRNAKPVTRRQNFLNWLGEIPQGSDNLLNLDEVVYEYNPNSLPPVILSNVFIDVNDRPAYKGVAFNPAPITIDGRLYSVDIESLPKGGLTVDTDLTADELFL